MNHLWDFRLGVYLSQSLDPVPRHIGAIKLSSTLCTLVSAPMFSPPFPPYHLDPDSLIKIFQGQRGRRSNSNFSGLLSFFPHKMDGSASNGSFEVSANRRQVLWLEDGFEQKYSWNLELAEVIGTRWMLSVIVSLFCVCPLDLKTEILCLEFFSIRLKARVNL